MGGWIVSVLGRVTQFDHLKVVDFRKIDGLREVFLGPLILSFCEAWIIYLFGGCVETSSQTGSQRLRLRSNMT